MARGDGDGMTLSAATRSLKLGSRVKLLHSYHIRSHDGPITVKAGEEGTVRYLSGGNVSVVLDCNGYLMPVDPADISSLRQRFTPAQIDVLTVLSRAKAAGPELQERWPDAERTLDRLHQLGLVKFSRDKKGEWWHVLTAEGRNVLAEFGR
jgi:hypothetical protein